MSILSKSPQFSQKHVVFAGASDQLQDFFSVRFACSNAKIIAKYLHFVFGFQEIAYRGLETGGIFEACHVLRCNNIVFEIVSPLVNVDVSADQYPDSESSWEDEFCGESPGFEESPTEREERSEKSTNESGKDSSGSYRGVGFSFVDAQFAQMLEIPKFQAFMTKATRTQSELQMILNEYIDSVAVSRFVSHHGFGVLDVAFSVHDAKGVFSHAVANGAIGLQAPAVVSDENGSVVLAILGSPNTDLRHTIVQKIDYRGAYLPNYGLPLEKSEGDSPPAYAVFPETTDSGLLRVDHCVQNFSWNEMKKNAAFYAACFGMSKFWSVDEEDVSTERSGLNSTVMISRNGKVKMPINEPVKVKMRGQIEEYYDFHGGPGVQHLALQTEDILQSVQYLRNRGMAFNTVSDVYYAELKQRLESNQIRLFESFADLQKNHILVDFDPNSRYLYRDDFYTCHYILQIFTKPIQDRPTFFFEIIQRHNHNGFGKGTFKGLFETIEREQMARGTL